ncbi:MAG: 23S rRNA (pseudouridine(1915)-N(3))-methyltransferase RlmH [Gemmatimonadota bacterium]
MKVSVIVVGKPGPLIADAVLEYQRRAARYWILDVVEVKEERGRKGLSDEQIRAAESERLLERVPPGAEVCALTRTGKQWNSDDLAQHLDNLAVHGKAGVAFLIGGALGLSDAVITRAERTLSLSPMTITHELARLIIVEQLYRAGTILRGEPYHKARS